MVPEAAEVVLEAASYPESVESSISLLFDFNLTMLRGGSRRVPINTFDTSKDLLSSCCFFTITINIKRTLDRASDTVWLPAQRCNGLLSRERQSSRLCSSKPSHCRSRIEQSWSGSQCRLGIGSRQLSSLVLFCPKQSVVLL